MLAAAALTLSVVLSLTGSVVSVREIAAGTFRPNLVTRWVWTSATVIGFVTAVAGGAGWAAVPIGGLAVGSAVVTAGAMWRGGYWDLDRLDVSCGVLAAVGLGAWQITGDPALATIAAVTADGLAAIPTFRHVLRAPQEESWRSYSYGGLAAVIGLGTLDRWTVASAGFSVYVAVLCAVLVTLILVRGRSAQVQVESTS